jgi:triacylglycerol lipase
VTAATAPRLATAAVAALTLVAGAACTTKPPSGPASGHTPVVLVHGYVEGNAIWPRMISGLKADGYRDGDITNFAYNTTGAGAASAAATAADRLATAIDAAIAYARRNGNPGAAKVDIISHSYGSLVSRWCMALGRCAGKVAHWMSLAGADGGTNIAAIPAALGQGSGAAMNPNGQTVAQLHTPEAIAAIDAQGVKVMVQWTMTDGIIIPARNSQWPGPDNPDPAHNREVTDVTHLTIFNSQDVIDFTIRFLRT